MSGLHQYEAHAPSSVRDELTTSVFDSHEIPVFADCSTSLQTAHHVVYQLTAHTQ